MHEFENLWKTQPLQAPVTGDAMLDIVIRRSANFDRTITARNRRETIAGVFVAVIFSIAAWFQTKPLSRVGSLLAVAAAIWIIIYLRRYGASTVGDPTPDQTLEGYREALARKYDHQIRLLKSAKFWYVLPLYVAITVITAGAMAGRPRTHPVGWHHAIPFLIQTLVFGGVWWLNEVYGVRKLREARMHLGLQADGTKNVADPQS